MKQIWYKTQRNKASYQQSDISKAREIYLLGEKIESKKGNDFFDEL